MRFGSGSSLFVVLLMAMATLLGWWFLTNGQVDSRSAHDVPAMEGDATESTAEAERIADTPAPGEATHDPTSNDRPNIASYAIESSGTSLPPPDTALTQTYAELKRRALAGDNRASCRLAADLLRCSRLQDEQSHVQYLTREASQAERDSAAQAKLVARAARASEDLARLQAMCQGFTPESPHAAFDYLLLAAERGDVRAMVALASKPPLDQNYFLRDQAQWQRYLQLVGPYLQRGVEAGEPFALYMLWWVLAGHPTVGGYAGVPPDPFQARVHAHAVLMVGDTHTQQTMRRWLLRTQDQLTPAQDAQAQLLGQALAREHFAKVKPERLSNMPRRLIDCSLE
ncbi:MAG: hypothetical protein AB7E72_06120 [Lysobacterales bacterium]